MYWRRLNELQYGFLSDTKEGVDVALRFALSIPDVHTAIVGTTKPGRWAENAKILEQGMLSNDQYEAIRARWKEVARPDWIGKT